MSRSRKHSAKLSDELNFKKGFNMKNIKKLCFTVIAVLILVSSFAASIPKVLAATGGGTATIGVDGGAQGAGVTVVQSTSHKFTTVLTINVSGMTLGAASPTFTIPTGFTAPNANPVATAVGVDADGEWSVVAGTGSCVVDSAPGSLTTIASGQVITVDITASCADGDTITLTYQGTSATVMGATALTVSTADAGDPGPVEALLAGSPTITVTAAPTPTPAPTSTPTPPQHQPQLPPPLPALVVQRLHPPLKLVRHSTTLYYVS